MQSFALAVLGLLILTACSAEPEGSGEMTQQPAGKEIYDKWCISCHLAGISNAPRLAEPKDWVQRLPKGRAIMLKSVIEGIVPSMPARGLCRGCSDEELGAALDYMLGTLPETESKSGP